MEKNMEIIFEIDIFENTIIFYKSEISNYKLYDIEYNTSYDYETVYNIYLKDYVELGHQKKFIEIMNIDKLQQLIKNDKTVFEIVYCANTNLDKMYKWFKLNIEFLENGKAKGVIQNVLIEDSNKEKDNIQFYKSENTIQGILKKEFFINEVETLLKNNTVGTLWIFDFEVIDEIEDEMKNKYILHDISKILREKLPQNMIIGIWEDNKFIAYSSMIDDGFITSTLKVIEKCIQKKYEMDNKEVKMYVGNEKISPKNKTIKKLVKMANANLKNGMKEKKEYTKNLKRVYKSFVNATFKNKKILILMICIMSMICMITMITTSDYIERLDEIIISENTSYAEELTRQITKNLTLQLENNKKSLSVLMNNIENSDATRLKEIFEELDLYSRAHNYEEYYLIDTNGVWYNSKGVNTPLALTAATQKIVKNKEYIVELLEKSNNNSYFLLGLPFDEYKVVDDNIQLCGIVAYVTKEEIQRQCSQGIFNNMGYSMIVDKYSNVILDFDNTNMTAEVKTLSDVLKKIEIEKADIFTIRNDLIMKNTGSFHHQYNDEGSIVVYQPMNFKDWSLVTITKLSLIKERARLFIHWNFIILMLLVGFSFFVIIILIFIEEQFKKKVETQAYIDSVTKGNSKWLFEIKSRKLLEKKHEYTMIYVNVKHFKLISDRIGLAEANRLLECLYESIESGLESQECVARITGNRFAILTKCSVKKNIEKKLKEWHKKIIMCPILQKYFFTLQVEYGVYFIEDKKLDIEVMIDRANMACEHILHDTEREIQYAIYDSNLKEKMAYESELEDYASKAMEENEFRMYLQPVYSCQTKKIVSLEALCRWESAKYGTIAPNVFIPIFEKNGFVIKLDQYILAKACEFINKLKKEGVEIIPIAVNVSMLQVQQKNFIESYKAICKSYDVPLEYITIELTESMVFKDEKELIRIVKAIRETGFKYAVDDFGSGYSSLRLLGRIHPDVVKLDRGFFDGSKNSEELDNLVIEHIIMLSKSLNMKIIAEGIETTEKFKLLQKFNCDYVQGFLFEKPKKSDEIYALLKDNR
ncbi:MAG: EAL domain-containing protein [Cellulosilyticaceae bacterium]